MTGGILPQAWRSVNHRGDELCAKALPPCRLGDGDEVNRGFGNAGTLSVWLLSSQHGQPSRVAERVAPLQVNRRRAMHFKEVRHGFVQQGHHPL